MNIEDKNNTFAASDWFDINFLTNFIPSDTSIKKQFNEKKYKIGDERLSSRVLNHWYESGIITDDRPNGKGWKKFSSVSCGYASFISVGVSRTPWSFKRL